MLAACANNINSTNPPKTPLAHVTQLPTQFSLGKCVDVRLPTPNPQESSLFPKVGVQEHILGKADAYVTIVVYSDFQCSSCANLASLLRSFVDKYPNDVRVVFRNYPLISIHDKAALSAQAAEAAGLQGKFWELHDYLFAKQNEWQDQKPADFQKWIIDQAASLGLDKNRLEVDLNSSAIKSIVQKSWDDGQKIKLPGTPVILINGEIIKWQVNLFDQLENYVKMAMLPENQFSSCPPVVIDPTKQYTAIINTSKGTITIKLFADKAPNTVNNFIFLAQKGWFDNNPFYRVLPGVVVQTGDPTGTGLGGPGYFIPSEINKTLMYDRAGMVGMANTGPDTNGSQFFIALAPSPHLNKDYPIFGEVISGMDVLAQLTSHDPADPNAQSTPDILLSIKIEGK
jgi:cyclophilin family peptidyl-prolyl cis-trans isomerase/protein-disulfide isomerase